MTQVKNNQVVLRNYVTGFPKESLDMKIVETITTLKLPKDPNEVLLKNLYLSYDAYMQILMTKDRLVQVGPYALGRVSHILSFKFHHISYFLFFLILYNIIILCKLSVFVRICGDTFLKLEKCLINS